MKETASVTSRNHCTTFEHYIIIRRPFIPTQIIIGGDRALQHTCQEQGVWSTRMGANNNTMALELNAIRVLIAANGVQHRHQDNNYTTVFARKRINWHSVSIFIATVASVHFEAET